MKLGIEVQKMQIGYQLYELLINCARCENCSYSSIQKMSF